MEAEKILKYVRRGPCDGKEVFWRNIFLFVCCPLIILSAINAIYFIEEKPRPPFVPYSYLRIRNKPFPWRDGNKSLFHNPHTNALPDGYEDESKDED